MASSAGSIRYEVNQEIEVIVHSVTGSNEAPKLSQSAADKLENQDVIQRDLDYPDKPHHGKLVTLNKAKC